MSVSLWSSVAVENETFFGFVSILMGFSTINQPFGGTSISGNHFIPVHPQVASLSADLGTARAERIAAHHRPGQQGWLHRSDFTPLDTRLQEWKERKRVLGSELSLTREMTEWPRPEIWNPWESRSHFHWFRWPNSRVCGNCARLRQRKVLWRRSGLWQLPAVFILKTPLSLFSP